MFFISITVFLVSGFISNLLLSVEYMTTKLMSAESEKLMLPQKY